MPRWRGEGRVWGKATTTMRRALIALSVAAAVASAAPLSAVYGKNDYKAAVEAAKAVLSSDKVSPQEAYAASTILSGSSKKLASDGLCSYLIGFSASTGTSLLDSSLALAASSSLGCNPVIDGAVVTRAQSGLESGDLPSIYGASLLLPLIAGAGKDLSVSWPSIIDEITQLVEEDGKFRSSRAKGSSSSTLNTGFAYSLFATAWPSVADSPSSKRILASIQTLGELLNDATGSESTTMQFQGGVAGTAGVLKGLFQLEAARGEGSEQQILTPAETAAFTAFLIASAKAAPGDVVTASQVISALKAIAGSAEAPVAVYPETNVIDGSSISVVVSDVFGDVITGTAAPVLKSGKKAGSSSAVIDEPVTLTQSSKDKTKYSGSLGKKLAPGSYVLTFAVESAFSESIDIPVKVTGTAGLSTATIVVTEGSKKSKAEIASVTATFPNQAAQKLSAGSGSFVHVTFDVKSGAGEPFSPHQAFVRLTQLGSTVKPAVFVATAESVGSFSVSLDVSNRDSLKSAAAGGVFSVEVLVGDSVLQSSIRWAIGSITLTPPAPLPTPDEILYTKPLLHESDVTLKALPEIAHQFRTPDTRASPGVAFLFTLLALAPLAALLIGLFAHGGANMSRVQEVNPLALLGFEVSLGIQLALLVLYWLQLNMFEVLVALIAPSITATFFGHAVLKALKESTAATDATTPTKPKKD